MKIIFVWKRTCPDMFAMFNNGYFFIYTVTSLKKHWAYYNSFWGNTMHVKSLGSVLLPQFKPVQKIKMFHSKIYLWQICKNIVFKTSHHFISLFLQQFYYQTTYLRVLSFFASSFSLQVAIKSPWLLVLFRLCSSKELLCGQYRAAQVWFCLSQHVCYRKTLQNSLSAANLFLFLLGKVKAALE